MFKFFQRYW